MYKYDNAVPSTSILNHCVSYRTVTQELSRKASLKFLGMRPVAYAEE